MSGRCACGGVDFQVNAPLREVWNCHCSRCRRFTGHHMAATQVERRAVTFASDRTLRWYEPSSDAAYGFCSDCGSSLFWTCTSRPQWLTITAGCLDQPTGLVTTAAWWVAEHGDYHPRSPGLIEHEYDG